MMCGSIAQLGEHLPYKQRVTGSSPVTPTIQFLLIYFYGLVVQLVRTLACHARGREFESLPGRHRIPFKPLCLGGNRLGSGSVVERRLAKANVASSNLVFRSIWRHSQVVRQGPAKPSSPVQIWVAPPKRRDVFAAQSHKHCLWDFCIFRFRVKYHMMYDRKYKMSCQ